MDGLTTKTNTLNLFKFKVLSSFASMLIKFLTIAIALFFLVGCGGGGGSSGGGDNPPSNQTVYRVSFYDANLDFNGSASVSSDNPVANITRLKADLGITATALYRASSSTDVSSQTAYPITGDTNFYAIANVTEITDQAGLAAIDTNAATLAGKYILLSDIELDDSGDGVDSSGWNPIGSASNPFTGIFNGNGYKITNLWINRPSTNYVGLFSYIEGAKIRNLGVEINNSKGGVKGYNYFGAIAGRVYNSASITNSYATGSVSGELSVGGIAGYVYSSSIANSYFTGSVSGTNYYAGGIAGQIDNSASITNSYATGSVSGTDRVGGIAGRVYNSASITNSYATGSVSGTDRVGGIAGYVEYSAIIANNAAINQEVSGAQNVNRVVGYINGGSVQNNFAINTMSLTGSTSGNAGTPKPIADLKTRSTYESAINGDGLGGLGWKFGNDKDNPWKIDANKNDGYPYLYWL